jgi:hypothetical protein
LSANVSATWTLFYSSLELAGYTLTMGTTGRPSVVVTYSIQMNGGSINQSPTGAAGGAAPDYGNGGVGGGGLVIVAVTGYLDGTISAAGGQGASALTNQNTGNGSAGYSGYLIIIEGIVVASTGGQGASGSNCGYSVGSGGGGGYVGGAGGGTYRTGGAGGGVASTFNYSTRWSYVYTLLEFLGDEWQRYVLGRTLSSYIGATYLAGYGVGGGGGGCYIYAGEGGAAGGGGGMGGQVVIYMNNLYAPTANQIIAMGATGGGAYSCGTGGAGGAGGLVYILTHNLVAFSGAINVLGAAGMTGISDNAGGSGSPNTYAIFIV